MILPILKYGDSILRKKCFDIDKNEDVKELANNMTFTLKNAGGIGLAGPQVGIIKNIFIIDTSPLKENNIATIEKIFMNPVIRYFSEKIIYISEGCLSIPGIYEDIPRPDKIEIRYLDENYDCHNEILEGIFARIFQHEYDHLQGILFTDRVNPIRKKLLKSKLRYISKNIRNN